MRPIVFHRRADKYLDRMPKDRQRQIIAALEEVAGLEDILQHSGIKIMSGGLAGWYRLRVGVYRSTLQLRIVENDELLYVDYIGPRGGAYKK